MSTVIQNFDVSIVIPAYNEEKRITGTLEALKQFVEFLKSNKQFSIEIKEVIVVVDGAKDRTADVTKVYQNQVPQLKVIEYQPNQGKGHAVHTGMKNSTSSWILISDADNSTDWKELIKLTKSIQENFAQIAIASRDLEKSKVTRHQSFVREFMGKTFNWILRTITSLQFRDTQCGFKLVNRNSIQKFINDLSVNRFAWDVEFLLFAKTFKLQVNEVAVEWQHQDDSRVRIIHDSLEMLFTVIKLKFKLLRIKKK